MERELVLFVPGLSATKPGTYTDELRKNLANYARQKMKGATFGPSEGGAKNSWFFTWAGEDAAARQYDFREIVWADLPTRLTERPTWRTAPEGGALLFYSLLLVPRMIGSLYQVASVLGSALILVLWYVGVVVVLPKLISDYYNTNDEGTDAAGFIDSVFDRVAAVFAPLVAWVPDWAPGAWAFVTLTLLFLPVTRIVDSGSMMKQYLWNESNLMEDVRKRLVAPLAEITAEARRKAKAKKAAGGSADGGAAGNADGPPATPESEEPHFHLVTVLAYSFGAVPAIECLDFYYGGSEPEVGIRLITLGMPLPVAAAKNKAVANAARSLASGETLKQWYFLWSRKDWLSANPRRLLKSVPADRKLLCSVPVKLETEWWFNSHAGYFKDDDLARILLQTVPAQQ